MSLLNAKNKLYANCPAQWRRSLERLKASPLSYRLAKGMFWSLVGAVVSRGFALLSVIVIARSIGTVGLGEFGIVQSTIGMFGVFAGMGLGMTATKHVAQFRKTDPARAGSIASLTLVVTAATVTIASLVFLGSAAWLAKHTFRNEQLTSVFQVGAALLWVNGMIGVQTGILSGLESFRTIARIQGLGAMLTLAAVAIGAPLAGAWGAILAFTGAQAIQVVLFHISILQVTKAAGIPITLRRIGENVSILWRFSFPTLLTTTMIVPVNWICVALLVRTPDGFEENGILTAANYWFVALMFFPNCLGQVVLPVLSDCVAQDKRNEVTKTVWLALRANLLAVLPIGLTMMIASPVLMRSYGPNFERGSSTLMVILLCAVVAAIQKPFFHTLIALGRMWSLLAANCVWAALFLALCLAWVDTGAFGVSAARLAGYVVHLIVICLFTFIALRRHAAGFQVTKTSECDNANSATSRV